MVIDGVIVARGDHLEVLWWKIPPLVSIPEFSQSSEFCYIPPCGTALLTSPALSKLCNPRIQIGSVMPLWATNQRPIRVTYETTNDLANIRLHHFDLKTTVDL